MASREFLRAKAKRLTPASTLTSTPTQATLDTPQGPGKNPVRGDFALSAACEVTSLLHLTTSIVPFAEFQMPHTTTCPACSVKLNLKAPPTPGKRVRCPRCKEPFTPTTSSPPPTSDDEWYGAPDEDSYGDEFTPRTRRRPTSKGNGSKKKSQKQSRNRILIGAAAVFGLLFVGALIAVVPRVWNSVAEGVANRASSIADPVTEQAVATAATVNTGAPISDEECREFAASLEQAVAANDSPTFQRLVNFEAILDKSVAGIDLPQKHKAEFRRGAMSSAPTFGNQIFAQAKSSGYAYLHSVDGPGGIRQVWFRLKAEAGVNYHRFDLIRNSSQQVVSGDIYFVASGEYVSATMRRLLLPLAASVNRSIVDRITGVDSALVKNLPKIQELQQAAQLGNHSRVLQIYKSLPEELRRQKFILLMRTMSAPHVSEQEYVASMEEFKRYFPNDPCLDLLLIDYYMIKNQMPECEAAIDRLNAAVGGDPYLQVMRAALLLQNGQVDAARSAITPALSDKGVGGEAYAVILDVHLAANDYDATIETLLILEQKYGHSLEHISQVPEFRKFVRSPQYREWRAMRNGAIAPSPANSSSSPASRQPTQSVNTQPTGSASDISMPPTTTPPTALAPAANKRTDSPTLVFNKLKQAVMTRNAKAVTEFVAPIDGQKKFTAELKKALGDIRSIQPFMMTFLQQTREENDVAVGLCPYRKHARKPEGVFDQIFFVKIGGRWKVSPTLDQPPTAPEYQASVKVLQDWLDQQD